MVKSGSSKPPQTGEPVNKPENRLKRQTPFLSNIKFHSSLPEVPCDPKMLIAVLQPDILSQFSITSLEQDMRQDLILEGGIGIPLSVLDTERYAVPDISPPLAPEDAALLMGPATEEGTGAAKCREKLRGEGTELSWLMRTTYIANEMEERRQQKKSGGSSKAEIEAEAIDRDAQIAAIEASFEKASTLPEHIRDSSLTPVEIMPVLPDLDRWRDPYVRMAFDGEPTADHDRLASLPAETAKRIAERALMKSFTLRDPDGKEQKFVAYMLPLEDPGQRNADKASSSRDGAEDSTLYEWVREYNYKVLHEEDNRTFWFQFENGVVTYTDLNTKLTLTKRGKQATSIPRPSQVTLKRRRRTAQEEEEGRKKLRELTGEDNALVEKSRK